MFLGVDLGTSGIKLVLTDDQGHVLDSAQANLTVSRPQALWSEQDPADWWQGFCRAMDTLAQRRTLAQIKAIGLSGQMHGATLLDSQHRVIRPAILWNDGRSEAQCRELELAVENARSITGNLMMSGFTAPKLLWVRQHEPEHFSRIHKVLLPKDYLRFLLTGEFASDMSDAAGTLWLDVDKRQWHPGLLRACGLDVSHMPRLFEGSQITGHLLPSVGSRWGMGAVPIVAGGGDNAAGAVGAGIVTPGQAMLSLGTSGVYFAVSDGFVANPAQAVHSFCHALPNTWHLMSVMLSAASCVQWFADKVVNTPVADLFSLLEQNPPNEANIPLFLPYLGGERTPHNNPHVQGSFIGVTHSTDKASLMQALLEGVSMGMADGADALHQCMAAPAEINVIGGGGRSPHWRQMLADILGIPIVYREGGAVGPALGAARLAQLAIDSSGTVESMCAPPAVVEVHQPDPVRGEKYQQKRQRFQRAYEQTVGLFSAD